MSRNTTPPMKNDRRRSERRVRPAADHSEERRHDERRQGERRRDARAPLRVWVMRAVGGETVLCLTSNLSLGGVEIDYGLPHPVGTRVRVRFEQPVEGAPLEIEAEVVGARWDDRPRTHLRFEAVSDPDRARLATLVRSASL